MNKTVFKMGELFCGTGELACGAIRSTSDNGAFGISHVWANDYDPDTCQTYTKNICPTEPESVYFGTFHMRMAQDNNKALHSAESNALIGEWIRKRLNAPSDGYITKQMLELYGKTYVTFRKYADGTYLLDF